MGSQEMAYKAKGLLHSECRNSREIAGWSRRCLLSNEKTWDGNGRLGWKWVLGNERNDYFQEWTRFRFQPISNESNQLLNSGPGRTPMELCWGSYSGFADLPWPHMERTSHPSCSHERSESLDRLSYVRLPRWCPGLKMQRTPQSWTDTSTETQTVKPTVTLTTVTENSRACGWATVSETPPIPLIRPASCRGI